MDMNSEVVNLFKKAFTEEIDRVETDEEVLYVVLVDRLDEYLHRSTIGTFWGGMEPITLSCIKQAIIDNIAEQSSSWQEVDEVIEKAPKKELRNWHLGRIVYLINNPEMLDLFEEIKPLKITCEDKPTSCCAMSDGNHRYMAHLYLRHETIKCICFGEGEETLNYLIGVSDIKPNSKFKD